MASLGGEGNRLIIMGTSQASLTHEGGKELSGLPSASSKKPPSPLPSLAPPWLGGPSSMSQSPLFPSSRVLAPLRELLLLLCFPHPVAGVPGERG